MISEPNTQEAVPTPPTLSLKSAALVAGFSLLIMVLTAPVAELYVFPKLIVKGDGAQTLQHLVTERGLFVLGIFGYLITFLADIVVAWALYFYLKPVNRSLSFLASLFRLVYTVIALIALSNLTIIYKMINTGSYSLFLTPEQLNSQVMLHYYAFKSTWNFGILFFGIHLGLLAWLCWRSHYIPGLLAILLFISALGYSATTLQPYLAPGRSIDFAKYTFYGELVFMLWLLIKGWRVPKSTL